MITISGSYSYSNIFKVIYSHINGIINLYNVFYPNIKNVYMSGGYTLYSEYNENHA
jgi:hypothetical protein